MDSRIKNSRKLSKAIQTCISDLVDKMPFNDSEIPDILIQEGCITEDECKELRTKSTRKDQARKLVLLIKGRSYHVMKKFLTALQAHCPTSVEKIWSLYDILTQEKTGPWKCPACELKEYVDVKYVIDPLYEKEIIKKSLYSIICDNQNPVGQQDYLWDSVLQACAGSNFVHLICALKVKDHYTHIADSLRIYHKGKQGPNSCLSSNSGTAPATKKPNSDETESSTTCSPKSTPFTSTVEEENTSPKVVSGTEDILSSTSFEHNTTKTYSDMYSDISEITVVKANSAVGKSDSDVE